MNLARIWILGGVVLASGAARLLADSVPDPTMTFNVPGHHSFDLSQCDTFEPCTFSPGVVGSDGFATSALDIKNDTEESIDEPVTELIFFIPTDNFNQFFLAHTNNFVSVSISFDQTGDEFGFGPVTVVDFAGIGNTQVDGGTAGAFGCPESEECLGSSTSPGFIPGATIEAEAFFGSDAPPNFAGLQVGEDGSLDLTAPEPGSFVLLLSAAGVLALGRRRLCRK